jgi:hypothetical protein
MYRVRPVYPRLDLVCRLQPNFYLHQSPFESVGKSSADEAAVRIAANFIAREWWLTKGPYDPIAVDPSPTLENRKLDAVEQPWSDRLQVSALSLAQRGLIYDACQSA